MADRAKPTAQCTATKRQRHSVKPRQRKPARSQQTGRRASPDTPAATVAPAVPGRTYTHRDGSRRQILLAAEQGGAWVAYDVPAGRTRKKSGLLVDRLTGCGDLHAEALAVAEDYQRCQIAFHAGERREMPSPDPLPKATEVPLAQIRGDVRRANRILAGHHSQQPAEQLAA